MKYNKGAIALGLSAVGTAIFSLGVPGEGCGGTAPSLQSGGSTGALERAVVDEGGEGPHGSDPNNNHPELQELSALVSLPADAPSPIAPVGGTLELPVALCDGDPVKVRSYEYWGDWQYEYDDWRDSGAPERVGTPICGPVPGNQADTCGGTLDVTATFVERITHSSTMTNSGTSTTTTTTDRRVTYNFVLFDVSIASAETSSSSSTTAAGTTTTTNQVLTLQALTRVDGICPSDLIRTTTLRQPQSRNVSRYRHRYRVTIYMQNGKCFTTTSEVGIATEDPHNEEVRHVCRVDVEKVKKC